MSDLYNRIHSLCESKGIKDGTMCREANVPRSTFQELKMGRTEVLSLKTLQKIADYFGISVSELTGESDKKEEPDRLLPAGLDTSGMNKEQLEVLHAVSRTMRESEDGEERLRLLLKGAGIIK